jgi:uncharacterized protein (TIGR02145 family)/uncharacterized repeat protein (TIGR02543 family)
VCANGGGGGGIPASKHIFLNWKKFLRSKNFSFTYNKTRGGALCFFASENIFRLFPNNIFKGYSVMKTTAFKAAAVAAFVVAASATAQETAYVPFVVNTDATVTAQQDETVVSMSVKANEEKTLAIPLGGITSVWNTGRAQGRLNALTITGSRGNISLRLPAQSYRSVEIAVYSVNGRQILRGKASATETTSGISRRNVAPGVYLLSVKGMDGNAYTTRLTHIGGNMNIYVAFGEESDSHSPAWKLVKQAEEGDWEITVSADGYITQIYTLKPVVGINNMQVINLYLPPVITTFTDSRDGKTYKKVAIGSQVWMGENLNYYIPNVTSTSDVCYENRADSCAKYGRLYNWFEAMYSESSSSLSPSGVQGVCPVGWHLPSDAEWDTLMTAIGASPTNYMTPTAGIKLKSTSGWNGDGNGIDAYGFSALPGGHYSSIDHSSNGYYGAREYSGAGEHGWWWSATESGNQHGIGRGTWFFEESMTRSGSYKTSQYSVRCVQDAETSPPPIYTLTIASTTGGSVSPLVGAHSYGAGAVVTAEATANSGYTFMGWTIGASTYTSAAMRIVINGNKTLTANFQQNDYVPPTFTDSRDGKTYRRIPIGSQVWMGENLNYNASGSVCYENSADSCAKYGRLYNWATAMGISESYNDTRWNGSDVKRQGACPVGWHIPNVAEWETLMTVVSGRYLWSQSGWNSCGPDGSGTPYVCDDDYGFSALPGGAKGSDISVFSGSGETTLWWSAKESGSNVALARDKYGLYGGNSYKIAKFSVRCMED